MKKWIKKALLSMCATTAVVTVSAATAILDVKTSVGETNTAETTGYFEMVDGASIRMAKPLGLRFIAEMSKDVYTDLTTTETGVTKEMGMFIVPYTYLADATQYTDGTVGNYHNLATKIHHVFYNSNGNVTNKIYQSGDYYRANGVIGNLYLQNYDREFVGIAYISETTGGVTTYTYADFDEENDVRSSVYVAIEAYDDYSTAAQGVFYEYVAGAHLETLGMTETKSGSGESATFTYSYNGVTSTSVTKAAETAGVDFSISLDKSVVYVKNVGDSAKLTVTIKDRDTVVTFADAHALWSSSNEDILTVDKEGNITTKSAGTATVTASFMGESVSCEVIVEAITFETMTAAPSYMTKADTTESLSIVDGGLNSGKALCIKSNTNTSATYADRAPALKVTLDFIAAFFEDENVDYIAFNAKSGSTKSSNFRRVTLRSNGTFAADCYEDDISTGSGATYTAYNGISADAYKTFYFSRADYEAWVAQGVTSERFIAAGNWEQGDSIYVDNISTATEEERLAGRYSLEDGNVRIDGNNMLIYMGNNNGGAWQWAVLPGAALTSYGYTNDIVSDGIRAFSFTPVENTTTTLRFNSTTVNMYTQLTSTGYYAFDLYVPEDADTTFTYRYLTNSVIPGNPVKAGGWTTFYLQPTDNVMLQLKDTTGSTYAIDNFRSITAEEFQTARYSFEPGAGGLRTNLLNDANTNSGAFYYYGYKDDYTSVTYSFAFAEGNGTGDVAAISNPRYASDIVHSGNYSLAFDKGSGYTYVTMNTDSTAYANLSGGFSFWIYSTTAINGTTASNFINGDNAKFNGGAGMTIPANTWTQVIVTASDIKNGRFLIMQGSWAGTVYIDDIEPIDANSVYTVTYEAAGGSLANSTQTVIKGMEYTLATPTAPKLYQEFTGWVDQNGNPVATSGVWDYAENVTLTATYSDAIVFESMTSAPSYITPDTGSNRVESLSIADVNGNKALRVKTYDACENSAGVFITTAFLNEIFADASVQYMAFDLMFESATAGYIYYRDYTDGTTAVWTEYEANLSYHSFPTDSFRTFYFPRSAYENWVTKGVSSDRFLQFGTTLIGGASVYIDNIRPATGEDYNLAILGFEAGANGLRDNIASDNAFYYYGGEADYTTVKYSLCVSGSPLTEVHFDNEIVHGGDYSLALTKENLAITFQMRADSTAYALLKHGFTFWIYSTVAINGSTTNFIDGMGNKLFDGKVIQANEWIQVTITEDSISHATSSDGACPFLKIQGSTAGTIYIDDIVALPYEEVEEGNIYNATYEEMEDGVVNGIVLAASTHTYSNQDALPASTADTEDMSYIRFGGSYGLNDFLVFDFTGDNMPIMSFFNTTVTNTIYNQEEDSTVKGWIVTNGMTTPQRGLTYGGLAGAHANRIAIIGSNKISYKYDDNGYGTQDGVAFDYTNGMHQNRASEGSAASPSPISMASLQAAGEIPYRAIVGWVENGDYMNLVMYVIDLTTGQTVVEYNLNKSLAKADWEGDIALHGHFGRETVIDALYPIEENTDIDTLIEKYTPSIIVYNGEWDGNGLTLAASTHVGADENVPLNSGYQEDMSYIAFNGTYGLNDYVVFDFTGDNFPFVSFFNTEITKSIFNFTQDTSVGGWIIANGINTKNGQPWGGETHVNASRIQFIYPYKLYNYGDNGDTAQNRTAIGSADEPSPISMRTLMSITDTYRAIIGFVDNGKGNDGATARIYVINMVTGAVVVDYTQSLTSPWSEGGIALHGQFGTGTKLDQVFGVEEDTTLDALIAKYGKDTDYSDEEAVTLDRYGYSSLSDGQWTLDGTEQVTNPTDHRENLSTYTTYKNAGFNILLAQDMISTDGTKETWEASVNKTYMDNAYSAGLKVILTDWHLQTLSKPISVSSSGITAADSTYVPWIIGTDVSATTGAAADYLGYLSDAGITVDSTRFANRDVLDKFVYDQLAPYMNHPAFYGVMLADEPSYHNAYCYGEIYKSIKRVAPDCYVQYNLLPLEHSFGTIQYRMPGVNDIGSGITNAQIEAAYKSYVESFLDTMGTDYIQYDDYPFKSAKASGLSGLFGGTEPYVDPTSLRNIQLVAEIAKERDLDVKVVTQSCLMKSGGEDGVVHIRQITENDARWLNNYLMGFGVKQINYFTYFTKRACTTSGEYFVDGGSFVNRDGTTTALYDFMKTIMADNTKFAQTISHFDYNASQIFGSDNDSNLNNEHISWSSSLTAAVSFRWLSSVTTSLEYTLVTELYDKDNYNYMYMVMNTIDPNSGGTQSITITLDSSVTAFYVYDQSGNRTEVTGNTYTVESLTAGQAIYIMPKF